MDNNTLRGFCHSPLWNDTLTWHSSRPTLTPCFVDTVLCWVPAVFLLLFLPYSIFDYRHRPRTSIPLNWHNRGKLALAFGLLVTAVVEFAMIVREWRDEESMESVSKAQLVSALVRVFTSILVGVYLHQHRGHGYHNSGVLWFYLVVHITALSMHVSAAQQYRPPQLLVPVYVQLAQLAVLFVLCSFPENVLDDKSAKQGCPRDVASFPSKLIFQWFDRMALTGWRKDLTMEDLWPTRRCDQSVNLCEEFNRHWNNANVNALEGKSTTQPGKSSTISTFSILLSMFFGFYLFPALGMLCSDLLQIVNPTVLKFLISFMSNVDEPNWHGGVYLFIFVFTNLFQTLTSTYYQHRMALLGSRIRTCLTGAIYRKSMLLTTASKKSFTTGEIISLMAIDSQRILELVPWINYMWSAPLQIIITVYLLWQELGFAVLGGLVVMLALIPINVFTANRVKRIQAQQMKAKDRRLKLVNEMLNGVKVLKLYGWEEAFAKKIEALRQEELAHVRRAGLLSTLLIVPSSLSAFMVTCTTFAIYILSDNTHVLTPEKAFVSIALFNLLRLPLIMIPNLVSRLILAFISIKRVNRFLNSEEKQNYVHRNLDTANAIDVQGGTFSWEKEEEVAKTAKVSIAPTLSNINLQIPKGHLVAVVGSVGSGKSSLLHALLGEMHQGSGSVNISADMNIAYVAQQAWIQNATVQKNILFGQEFDRQRYDQVVEACALRPDFRLLPGGDQTEIGEKGINLSGGQKQRISIARSCYSQSDLYLFDDPLSAVDSHVGKHIFDKVFSSQTGLLRNRTRVLVTNALYMLPNVDSIVMLREGTIEASGSYQQLMKECDTFRELIESNNAGNVTQDANDVEGEEFVEDEEVEVVQDQLVRSRTLSKHSRSQSMASLQAKKEEASGNKDTGQLIKSEKVEKGATSLHVYHSFFQSITYFWVVVILTAYVVSNFFSYGTNFWLAAWTERMDADNADNRFSLLIYFLLGAGQAATVSIGYMSIVCGMLRASRTLHTNVLHNVAHAPMHFFDTTPLGRILNRFSKDIDILDTYMVMILRVVINASIQVVATLITVSTKTPLFAVIVVPFIAIYLFIQRFYIKTSRQLKRLESVTRSPILNFFGETLNGVTTIKAFGRCQRFIEEMNVRVDANQRCFYPNAVAGQWVVFRLELVSTTLIFFASFLAVYTKISGNNLSGSDTGLSLSYALNVTMLLNAAVRMFSEFENNVVAVERLKEYTQLEAEDDWHKPSDDNIDQSWPHEGTINFEEYATRYRAGLDLVLKRVDIHIERQEKIGIVGRTGAGKSSLSLALFRIIEAAHGKIIIDGVDIATVGLQKLRFQLTIIPQDPVIFVGTIRQNLDPLEQYTDQQLWRALELSHLKSFVSSLDSGLEHPVVESGENLSVGQRQLLCLARALLKKTKILVLDEASSAVDLETDSLIQSTIRSEFAHCTVLTIAHRLNTILDSDRILVLDAGRIAEFDSPQALLSRPSSIFHSLAKDAGLV